LLVIGGSRHGLREKRRGKKAGTSFSSPWVFAGHLTRAATNGGLDWVKQGGCCRMRDESGKQAGTSNPSRSVIAGNHGWAANNGGLGRSSRGVVAVLAEKAATSGWLQSQVRGLLPAALSAAAVLSAAAL
jgi:hypothetical protein